MVDLAAHSITEHVSLKSIAERQEISENYLEQVFSSLRKAGLVKSVKGAQGGYCLSKAPDKIMAGDILRALEGSLSIVDDEMEDFGSLDTVVDCLTENIWKKINENISSVVDSISLEALVNDYCEINNSQSYMYYI